jgi:uracil-DNA glycosylase
MGADGSIGQDSAAAGDRLGALHAAMLVCRRCREAPLQAPLPHEPRPIFRMSATARLVIASQAPGIRAHLSGIPFKDPSGVRLRAWLGLDEAEFYDASRLMILPMGFCFPGHDAQGGDLPPRGECRRAWHDRLFGALPQVETVLAIGLPSLRYHAARLAPDLLPVRRLTEAVEDWRRYFERPAPRLLPLPHPSWRNSGWLKRHPWFEAELLPVLRREVGRLM